MKNKKKTTSPKGRLLVVGGLLVVLAIVGVTKRSSIQNLITSDTNTPPDNTSEVITDTPQTNIINYDPSPSSENQAINEQKNNADKQQETPISTDLTATITNTRFVSNMAQISVLVSGTTNGNCTAQLQKTGESSQQKTVAIILKGGVYTCEDFNFDSSKLSKGVWDISVYITSGDKRSSDATATVDMGA